MSSARWPAATAFPSCTRSWPRARCPTTTISACCRPGSRRGTTSVRLQKAHLIIAVGYDPVEYAPKFWNPERKKQIVHIDFTPAEVDSYYQPAVEVVADVGNPSSS